MGDTWIIALPAGESYGQRANQDGNAVLVVSADRRLTSPARQDYDFHLGQATCPGTAVRVRNTVLPAVT